MIRVCVCVSGGGTNLEAIFKAIEEKKITVKANRFSSSAVTKIESAGGKAEVI